MNPRSSSYTDNQLLANPHRRWLLKGMSGLVAASAIGACAAPPPEPEPLDPNSLIFPPPPETPRFYYDRTIWGSNSVIEETSTDRFRRFATGESIRGQGMAKPFGAAAKDGRIFVSDTVSRRVHVFDYPRRRYYLIGTKSVGRVSKPLGVAADDAGNVYVADGTTKRVMVYDLEGNYQTALGVDVGLERPSGVGVNPDGSRIYVVETGGVRSQVHGVYILNRAGNLVRAVTQRGTGDGQFNLPLDVGVGPTGNIHVVDTGNFRVQVLDADGNFLSTFGGAGRFPGQFGHPKGIAVDREGKIYITDSNFGVFQIFNSEGRILMSIGSRNEAGGPAAFLLPAGIAVDGDGRIYVVDQFFRKVDVFRPAALPEDWPVGQNVA